MTQGRLLVALGAASAALAVGAGAFGAHGLAEVVDADGLRIFRTGASYHLLHSLAMCLIGVWLEIRGPRRALVVSGWALLTGIVCFSGSLYMLALGGPRWLGPITPLGGSAFILGWLSLAFAAIRR